MITHMPLVTIVMATYNPPLDWFKKQLQSLNRQDYDNIELLVIDDCSPKISINELQQLISEYITSFPFTLSRNQKNLGSTKTFEKLTESAKGKYISYCDQDDIWEDFKITKSVEKIEKSKALLVCSDVVVIDGNDKVIAQSITELRKRQVFQTGEGLAETLLFSNFVTGCTVLMDRETAQESLPFSDNMIHDQWLALYAASKGKIEVCDTALMKYRIHGNNQTGVLAGIKTKHDYYEKRILPFVRQMDDVSKQMDIGEVMIKANKWARARDDYFNGKVGAILTILKYRKLNISTSLFDIAIKFMPNFIFRKVLDSLQSGKI